MFSYIGKKGKKKKEEELEHQNTTWLFKYRLLASRYRTSSKQPDMMCYVRHGFEPMTSTVLVKPITNRPQRTSLSDMIWNLVIIIIIIFF